MSIFRHEDFRQAESLPAQPKGDEIKGSDADKAVQDLLEKDQSTLNAKQRRMVKRYRERHAEEESPSKNEEGSASNDSQLCKADNAIIPQHEEDQPVDCRTEKPDTGVREALSAKKRRDSTTHEQEANLKDASGTSAENGAMDRVSPERKELLNMLEGLNSKQRRKLGRQLDREGDEALEEIKKEAASLLKATNKDGLIADEEKSKSDAKSKDNATTPVGKKRKKDWSHLTPEERLRREEQRRLQKEAAERREREGPNSSGHRHPLNSERRRANRRKPKWTSTRPANDHDSSGYHMRKTMQQGQK